MSKSKKKETPKPAKAQAPDEKGQPEKSPEPPKRMVVVEITPDGQITAAPIGIDSLTIPTLLRLAAKEVESKFGI